MEYIKIRNWDKWQTYRADRGQPPWIKIHRCIMRDPEWVSLSDAERGQLIAMWLLAADHDGVIPASPILLQKLCFMSTEPDINKFTDLRFIEDGWRRSGVGAASERQPNVAPKAETEKNRIEYSEEFLNFYAVYPLKKSKLAAYKSWTKLKPDHDTCILAVKNQITEKLELRRAGKFCPEWKHPSVWLNKGCWEDETNTEPEITYESVEQ